MGPFGVLYPKLQKLHIALERMSEARQEESLLIRAQVELDAATSILDSMLDVERFLLEINEKLEKAILEIDEEEVEIRKKYPPEVINEMRDRVKAMLDRVRRMSKELGKEEKKEERELK
jgi:hypothetical protein